jgi:tetratricopeptide (TPR) repeat protein
MATYNKRGFKAPKPTEDKVDNTYLEDVQVDEKNSTTAGVFNTLDETANKTEEWFIKNQKAIFGVVGAIALATVGYILYGKYVSEPKEIEAANELFTSQQNFQQAIDGATASDSLFKVALNGADGKFGFVAIADNFSGTNAGNLANYYAGISYLNIGKNTEAIQYLEKFSSDDIVLSALAKGAIGDAFAQKNQMKEALEYYVKASKMNENDITTPRFLMKAGQTALLLGKKAEALNFFTQIKEKYEISAEARNIDGLIGLAQ